MELARRDAAEGDAFESMPRRQSEAGAVARRQQRLVPRRGLAGDNGADGVQDVFAGQVVRPRELRPAGLLLAPLFTHQLRAFQPELDSGVGVDAVPDTYHNHTNG